jgi:O-antigen/teichoic acid export membrane protein
MKKDYIITFITEFMVLICGILVYSVATRTLGKEGFSEYALSRRTISLIRPALLLGLSIAIPRYIAYKSTLDKKTSDSYFWVGLFLVFCATAVFLLVFIFFKKPFSFLLFGSSEHFYLIFPISLTLIGLMVHSLCYSFFRGKLMMSNANLLQMINMGIIPLFSVAIGENTVEALIITGAMWSGISFVFLFFIIKNLNFPFSNLLFYAKELLSYGIQRVPGGFGEAALFAIPATLSTHMVGMEKAGYVAFSLALLHMVGAVFAPIGLILLPKASQLIAKGDAMLLKYHIIKILKITSVLTLIGVIFFEIFADKIIYFYLGKSFADTVLMTKIIMLASLPYAIFVVMRSVIDAYYKKALNTLNVFISLAIFLIASLIVFWAKWSYICLIGTFVLAMFILGALTILNIKKIVWMINNENRES